MQYSDTTNKNGLLQRCEFLCNLGDAGISGNSLLKAQFTNNINRWYHKVVTMVLDSMDGWDFDDNNYSAKHPIVTRALVAARRDYVFSTAAWSLIATEGGSAGSNAAIKPLKIKRVDVCYDGTGNTCYRAAPLDEGESGSGFGNDADIDARFSYSKPFYSLSGEALNLYPRATADNVTNGGILRVTFTREIDEFTTSDTTQEPGIDEPFHDMLSVGASLDYAMVKGLAIKNDLGTLMQDYEIRLKAYYSTKNKDEDQKVLKSAYVNYE